MKKILAIAAHPDDLEFSCTATLHKLMQEGYKTRYLVITNGENGFKAGDLPATQRIQIRKEEQLRSAGKLGVEHVIFLDYKDGFLEYSEKLRLQLVEQIKAYQPEIIFSFDPANLQFDNLNLFHRDHRVAAQAVFDACFAAKNHWMYPGPAHRVERIYFYGSQQPNHFEDISDLIDFKLRLLACHQSQFPDFSKVERFIREVVSAQSRQHKYSEAFRILEVQQLT
jgi:LmbE family N-acetylglucosaminyl deacetylase